MRPSRAIANSSDRFVGIPFDNDFEPDRLEGGGHIVRVIDRIRESGRVLTGPVTNHERDALFRMARLRAEAEQHHGASKNSSEAHRQPQARESSSQTVCTVPKWLKAQQMQSSIGRASRPRRCGAGEGSESGRYMDHELYMVQA
jgi:hypothetical protein